MKLLEFPKIVKPTPKIELPQGIRTKTLKSKPLSKTAFAEIFDQKHIHVHSYTQRLIDRIQFTGQPIDMKLAWPSVRDLGLTRTIPYMDFLEAGQAKGYNKLHPEIALYLRIQDIEQPLNDWYGVAMDPIQPDRDVYPRVFVLDHNEYGLWLNAYWVRPSYLWLPDSRLVFSLSK